MAGSILLSEFMLADEQQTSNNNNNNSNNNNDAFEAQVDAREQRLYFQPESGNVLFACAVDAWAFGCAQFAAILTHKTAVPEGNFTLHLLLLFIII